jgi:hypothetical protein
VVKIQRPVENRISAPGDQPGLVTLDLNEETLYLRSTGDPAVELVNDR